MKKIRNSVKFKSLSRTIAFVGIMAAIVECGKLALSFIPNVEVVTLLLAVFSYMFGASGLVAALIFVCIEPLIWGFGTWVVSYLIYWPLVSLIFFFFGKLKIQNRLIITFTASFLTFIFGILTSLVDIGLLSGFFDNFVERFMIYYARGTVFYIVHIVSNTLIFFTLFKFITKKLEKIKHSISM